MGLREGLHDWRDRGRVDQAWFQSSNKPSLLGFSLLMAMLHTLLEISCYMLRSMKSMSFASLHTPHMHCKVSSVRIIQKHDLMGFNSLGCSRILTIQEVLSSRHGGMHSAQYRQDHQGGVPGGNFQPISVCFHTQEHQEGFWNHWDLANQSI